MRTGFTVSTIAHAGVIVLIVAGIGFGRPIDPPPVDSIAVDLVPLSEFSNIRLGSLKSDVVETDTPSVVDSDTPAELAQPTGNTQEDQPTPEDSQEVTPAPTQQTAPAPAPQAEPEPTPEPDPVPEETAPAVSQPEPEPEPAPEPVAEETPLVTPDAPVEPAEVAPQPRIRTAAIDQKRAEFKKLQEDQKQQAAEDKKKAEEEKKKKEEAAKRKAAEDAKRIEEAKASEDEAAKLADEVANIINTEETRGATTGEGGQATLGREDGRSATLSQSQIDGLIAQIKNCPYYNPPLGAADAGATAQLRFNIDADGNVSATPQIVASGDSQLERALASAAQRGVMRCGPYAMAVGQEVQAVFDPRLM